MFFSDSLALTLMLLLLIVSNILNLDIEHFDLEILFKYQYECSVITIIVIKLSKLSICSVMFKCFMCLLI